MLANTAITAAINDAIASHEGLSTQEVEQVTRYREVARALLADATLGMRDQLGFVTYTDVANAWLSLAELVVQVGTPSGGDVEAAEQCLLTASNPEATAAVRDRAFHDSAAYRRAARLAARTTLTKGR